MTYISAELRRLVYDRAQGCCEYCRLNQEDAGFAFHFEHIIAEKHGGQTTSENLCLSCPACNAYKGSDLSSVDWDNGQEVVPLFNPRKNQWADHFQVEGARIVPRTAHGRVTTFLLRFNEPKRSSERAALIRAKRYPCG
ncbi:MAG: HNH endonuclease [Anaerolinea sp.]|nr:HNH endonuclease [Anaerolinea sp.]